MYEKLQSIGGRLLERFIPKADAAAGCTPFCYVSCPSWTGRCAGKSCIVRSDCSVSC